MGYLPAKAETHWFRRLFVLILSHNTLCFDDTIRQHMK